MEMVNRKERKENSTQKTYLGSLIIALSGFLLYTDKVLLFFNIEFLLPQKFMDAGMDFPTYVWLMSQTISPILLIIGANMRPHTITYTIPLYCYALQLYFIFLDYKIIDNHYLQAYAVGTTVLFLTAIYGIRWLLHKKISKKISQAKKQILEYEH